MSDSQTVKLCGRCKKRPATVGARGGTAFCDVCREHDRITSAERSRRRKAEGRCRICGSPVTTNANGTTSIYCQVHYLKSLQYNREKRRAQREQEAENA